METFARLQASVDQTRAHPRRYKVRSVRLGDAV
jgi:hypothetical protein